VYPSASVAWAEIGPREIARARESRWKRAIRFSTGKDDIN